MRLLFDLQALHRLEQAVVDDDGEKTPKETLIATRKICVRGVDQIFVTKLKRDVDGVFWLTYGNGAFEYVF
jgi:hypothetical protein